jgi:hypothetical protein
LTPTDEDLGVHKFLIELRDNNPIGSLSKKYSFEVKVTESKELLEQMRLERERKDAQNYSISYRVGMIDDEGRFLIRFNEPMRIQTYISKLGTSSLEVALKAKEENKFFPVKWNAT